MPTPPRSRYAAVVTTAFVGAGVVALGTANALPDLKAQVGYATPDMYAEGGAGGYDLADRTNAAADRASRSDARTTTITSTDQTAPNYFQLPLRNYTPSSPFGWRDLNGAPQFHDGFDMAVPQGTPYYAIAPGTVILARWNGGLGYNVQIDHGNGIVSIYGHSSKLIVHEGQHVNAGDLLGLTGNTGFSFGPHLHLGIEINGKLADPATFMLKHGVDLNKHIEVVNGGVLPPATDPKQ